MFLKEACRKCPEATKYVEGFATLSNGSQAAVFACKNQDCEVYKLDRALKENIEEKRAQAQEENAANGVNIHALRDLRIHAHVLTMQMSDSLGIGPAEYSSYETGKKPMPKELYDKAMELLAQIQEKE